MSLESLKENGLYIILFVRHDTLAPDDFHWSLYHHYGVKLGGSKYHIKGGEGTWLVDHGVTKSVLKSFLLTGLCQIADIPAGKKDEVHALITQDDSSLNSIPGNTCRTWVTRALERLKTAGFLHCSDVVALEREVMDWGNSEQQATIDGVQPRAVVKSKLCGLA